MTQPLPIPTRLCPAQSDVNLINHVPDGTTCPFLDVHSPQTKTWVIHTKRHATLDRHASDKDMPHAPPVHLTRVTVRNKDTHRLSSTCAVASNKDTRYILSPTPPTFLHRTNRIQEPYQAYSPTSPSLDQSRTTLHVTLYKIPCFQYDLVTLLLPQLAFVSTFEKSLC